MTVNVMDPETEILTEAQRRLTALARENARLRAEVNEVRRKLRPGRHERVVIKAREDAKLILHLRHAQAPTSRRWLAEAGFMTPWRFGWALGLLRYARVDEMDVGTLQTLSTAIDRVESAAGRLLDNPGALSVLRHFAGLRYQKNRYLRP